MTTSYDNAPTDPHHGGKIWNPEAPLARLQLGLAALAPPDTQAQRDYDALNAKLFPPHPDAENAISYGYQLFQIFCRDRLVDALGHHDPRWVDRVAHAADKLVEAIRAADGETERPATACLIPEAV